MSRVKCATRFENILTKIFILSKMIEVGVIV